MTQMVPPPPAYMPPPTPQDSRFRRWGRQLMSGAAREMTSLPRHFASYAVAAYAIALLGVSLIYSSYAMEWYFWVFGIAWVAGFFFLSFRFSQIWNILHVRKSRAFEQKVFWTGFAIRAVYAIFIYFFYIEMTGKPYEFAAADSEGYIEVAEDWVIYWEDGVLWEVLRDYAKTSFSDMGYPLFILIPVRYLGVDAALVVLRLINALFGAWTSIFVYRLTRRSMSETTARFAAIFCMLHPVLICYVGMTLKEEFMTWLLLLFVNLADQMLRGKRYSFVTIAPVVLIGLVLFMFRTVLGMVAFMAVLVAIVLLDKRIISLGKKIIMGIVLVSILLMGASDNIMREVQSITDTDVITAQQNTLLKRYGSEKASKTGNKLAEYAGAAVFAPMIFTIPFPTMVIAIEGQEAMHLIHGGNWMRNVMSGFVILAMFMLLLSGDWRKYTLPLAMTIGYLAVLVFSAFAQSLRFHIPVMPLEMMFAAYAITNMKKKQWNWYSIWCMLMLVSCFAWNWFKLAGRGLS